MSSCDLNMKNSVYKNLLNLNFVRHSFVSILHETLAKSFKVMKNIKILKSEGDWGNTRTKDCFYRQYLTKYLVNIKKQVKLDKTGKLRYLSLHN